MLMRTRPNNGSRRRIVLALALLTYASSWADDAPGNRLRIVVKPTEIVPPNGADDEPVELVSPIKPVAAPEVKLVSDGWNARQAINQPIPLSDPSPQRPAYAKGGQHSPANDAAEFVPKLSDPQALIPLSPRSTLKFVVPETSYAQPAPRSTAGDQPSRSNKASEHSLFGPGAPPMKPQPGEVITEVVDNELRLLPAETNSASPSPDAAGKPATMEVADSECGAEPEVVVEPETLTEEIEEPAPIPTRIEVRELKLSVNGAMDPPSLSRKARIEPISNRNDARQSIGDETTELAAPETTTGDRIGSRGELILSMGMSSSQQRISPSVARLRAPIERTLNYYWNKSEDATVRTHWGMFHAIMVFDKDTPIMDAKRKYNAVAWMAGNNPCRNDLLFEEDHRGINVRSGIGLQGHQAQLLAVFGLIDVPVTYPIYVNRRKYSVEDVLRREMLDCKSGAELTFTLIGLSHYIDSDSRWVSGDGQDWDFERLIQEELAQPIVGSACGGTHRLMGFAHALRRRRAEGKPTTGQWGRAEQYVNEFIDYTWQLQNRDGSMSTSWFEKPDDNGKIERKIQTTGHMVEFLLTALPDEQLQSPQMLRSMTFLVNTLYEERGNEWQIGPKGHALRALTMYYHRVFGRPDPWRPVSVARTGTSRNR